MSLPFIPTVFEEGNVNTLLGLPRSGKTNLAVVLMKTLIEMGYTVWTNIHFFSFENINLAIDENRLRPPAHQYRRIPQELHVISSLSEVLIGFLTTERNIFILDEAGIFGSSTAPMTERVKTLKMIGYLIGHFNASMLLIAQARGSLAPALRDDLVTFQLKVRRVGGSRIFIVEEGVPGMDDFGNDVTIFEERDTFWDIPACIYPFDSKFMPVFAIDINLVEASERLGKLGDSIMVKKFGKQIIEELVEEARMAKEKKKDITEEYDIDMEVQRCMDENNISKSKAIKLLAKAWNVTPYKIQSRCTL